MKYHCNIFKGVYDKDCSHIVPVFSILKSIRDGKWKTQIELVREARDEGNKAKTKRLKENLPAATFSGTFSERFDSACTHYNGIMVVDIDTISNKRLQRLKIELQDNPWVFAYFDGPTKGIKILIFVDTDVEDHNTHCFEFVEETFLEMYGIQIDKSGKNISRLCFVSYDPNMYINTNPEVLHIVKIENPLAGFQDTSNWTMESENIVYDGKKILDVVVKMVKKSRVQSYHKGNRNNYVFSVSCLMSDFGVPMEITLPLVFNRYPSLGIKEINSTVKSAYRHAAKNFGTKTVNDRNRSQQKLL